MPLSIPIFDSRLIGGISGPGKYRLHFSVSTWLFGQPYEKGQHKEAGPYVIDITDVQEDRTNDKLIVEFIASPNPKPQAQQANIGAGAIILAAIVVGGVALLYLSLDKVEKVIESPEGQAAVFGILFVVIAVIVGAFLFYYKKIRGK